MWPFEGFPNPVETGVVGVSGDGLPVDLQRHLVACNESHVGVLLTV